MTILAPLTPSPRPDLPPHEPPLTPTGLLTRAAHALAGLLTSPAVLACAGLILAAAATVALCRAGAARRRRAGARLLVVRPPAQVDPAGAEMLWRTLLGLHRPTLARLVFGQPHVAAELSGGPDGARLALWVPAGVPPGLVEHALTAAWPGTRVDEHPPAPPVPTVPGAATGGLLRLAAPGHFPLRARHDLDPARPLLAALAGLQAGETACVQVLARPASRRRARTARAAAAALRNPAGAGARWSAWAADLADLALPGQPARGNRRTPTTTGWVDPWLVDDLRAVKDKTAQPLWEVAIRYAVASDDPHGRDRVRGIADSVASAFGVHTGRNRLTRRRLHLRSAASLLADRGLRRGFLLSVAELAAVAHLPHDQNLPGLEAATARRVPPLPRIPAAGKPLGDADTGTERPVAVGVADARHHLHVLGSTGSGKSTLLAQMILADAEAGRGLLAIDPKGDLITDVADRLTAQARKRLVLIDPDAPGTPPVLNILDGPDPDLVADHTVGIMSRLFAAWWGPRTDDILRAAVLTLTHPANPRRTRAHLGQVPLLLTEPAYRARLTAALTDPILSGFWAWYESLSDAARAQATGPVLNKLRAVLLRPFARTVLAAAPSTIDMTGILDGGICLVRLPKGRLGEDTTRLLGSFLLARAWQTTTTRARTGQTARRDAAIYLDEAQNFLTLPHALDDMLAEARGYRLSMVIAHQHLGQLGTELRDAVSANARNKILFTCSPEDARALERHVAPRLTADDLARLDGYQVAARLLVDGRTTPAFTLHTRPLPEPPPTQPAPHHGQRSQRRPGQPRPAQARPGQPRPAQPGVRRSRPARRHP